MADLKKINAEKFREILIRDFGDNDKVKILCDTLVEQNTDQNPFFYGAILNYITKNPESIFDLVDSNSKVNFNKINIVIEQAKKQFDDEKRKSENDKNNQNFENLVQEQLQKIDFSNITREDVDLFSKNVLEAAKCFNAEQFKTMSDKKSEMLEESGFKKEFIDAQRCEELVFKCIEDGNVSEKLNEPKVLKRLEELGFTINKDGTLYSPERESARKEVIEAISYYRQIEDLVRDSVSLESAEQVLNLPDHEPLRKFMEKHNLQLKNIYRDKENTNEQQEKDDKRKELQDAFEAYFDDVFDFEQDFADISKNQIVTEQTQNLQQAQVVDATLDDSTINLGLEQEDAHQLKSQAGEHSTQQPQAIEQIDADELLSQMSEQEQVRNEETYETPTIEEKTGFAKLLDRMGKSQNPVAKFLFNRISSFQNRDAKKLNETNPVIQPDEYTERPSKGRFGVGDSELMPNGTGIRNSFIRVGEGIMKLFQGNKAEKEPIQTRTPINPNHNQNEFDARYAVDLKNNAAANGIIVPNNVKSKNDNANKPRNGASSRDEGPSFDD